MSASTRLAFLLAIAAFDIAAHAARPPLRSRATTVASSIPIGTFEDSVYFVNMTLGGQTFSVSIDTGSADLWIYGDVPNAQDTGKTSSVHYAIGSAAGEILSAPLSFGGYNVAEQEFLSITDITSFGSDPRQQGFTGLVGLGPAASSNIFGTFLTEAAVPMMNGIFEQNLTSQNYITFHLPRDSVPDSSIVGEMTISEPVTGYEDILTQTKLPVVINSQDLTDQGYSQVWNVLNDKNGIIAPNGTVIPVESTVPAAAGTGQLVTVFDSGFTLPQVPQVVSDAFYSGIPGASFSDDASAWIVPCTAEVNITFVFGGQKIFVHPLDATLDATSGAQIPPVNGTEMCMGAFQPISSAAQSPQYDMILGMGFLRNVYILLDYGDFILDGGTDRNPPFVQLLGTTDPEQAHTDFVDVRLNSRPANSPGRSGDNNSSTGGSTSTTIHLPVWAWVAISVGITLVATAASLFRRHLQRQRLGPGVAGHRPTNSYFQMTGAKYNAAPQYEQPPNLPYHDPYAPRY